MFENYLTLIGLTTLLPEIKKTNLNMIVDTVFRKVAPKLSDGEITRLYQYLVPKLSPDGTCSILGELEEKAYNLAETFGLDSDIDKLRSHPQTLRLWRLGQIVKKLQQLTGPEWLGIYRRVKNTQGQEVLVKEAYYGVASRAEFPLTSEFAKKSNNSTVGLTGKAVLIQNIHAHQGAYYECDNEVNSEFCVPILNKNLNVIGIIDAEAFQPEFFTVERIRQISKVAMDLGTKNLGLSSS